MGIIKVMDENLSNKIAAGEVVERISNAVKELVENSIDAGAKNIKVELVSSGIKSIKVIDDGSGMDEVDASLAFGRHATSKLKNESDLYFINTLGFRGEALASIASVSKVILETSKNDDGTKVILEGGREISKSRGISHKGTIIEIKNIFFNTPVRLKFLKSEMSELSNITSVIEKLSISHPEISFSLFNNEKEILKTTGSNDLLKVIHEIYGFNVSKNMSFIKRENYDYSISGFITNLNISRSSRSGIITLVNGRVVQNVNLIRIIKDAYHTFLAENKYPVVILNIETDPTIIDVNIHPTKQDIRFSKMESLEELLFNLIRDKLNEIDNTFKGYTEIETKDGVNNDSKVYEEVTFDFSVNEENKEFNIVSKSEKERSLIKPVGLALGTYLIAQEEDMMYMIDIHAANERINYELYLNKLKNTKNDSIELLIPINIELPKNEYLTLMERIDILKSIGVNYEEFGINTIRILSHPTWLKEGYEEESIRRIIDLILEIGNKFDNIKFNDRLAMTLACKMSVKANTSISYEEEEILINRLFKCINPYTCPHGRPTIIKYPKYELEKLFKRVE